MAFSRLVEIPNIFCGFCIPSVDFYKHARIGKIIPSPQPINACSSTFIFAQNVCFFFCYFSNRSEANATPTLIGRHSRGKSRGWYLRGGIQASNEFSVFFTIKLESEFKRPFPGNVPGESNSTSVTCRGKGSIKFLVLRTQIMKGICRKKTTCAEEED